MRQSGQLPRAHHDPVGVPQAEDGICSYDASSGYQIDSDIVT